jgi:glycosyltransferase involved in cell wall biosynthesis
MTSPTVSTVIPRLNRAGSAGAAVESVLAQTYKNLDLIYCR